MTRTRRPDLAPLIEAGGAERPERQPATVVEANWLPGPAGKFILMMRLYWPQETAPSIIDGTWKPQGVKKVN